MGEEAKADTYDELYSISPSFRRSVESSLYYGMFKEVVRQVRLRKLRSVLEIGCGIGWLAELLMRLPEMEYRGFDFSAVAVQTAIERTGKADAFFVGDALAAESYAHRYEGIVCTEVLEHIERDVDVIAQWRRGVPCICSVPNFDYPTHVRYFRHEDDVRRRYGEVIEIDGISRVRAPLLAGRTINGYLRQVRWARRSPKKLMGLLGIKSFDFHGGWFVFSGVKKS